MILRFKDFLTEDHAQMELPFVKGGKKPMHVDFIDALESMSKKMLYQSDKSPETYLDAARKKVNLADWVGDSETFRHVLWNLVSRYGMEILSKKFMKDEELDADSTIHDINLDNLDLESLSPRGQKMVKSSKLEILDEADEYGMAYTVERMYDNDPDGLITVWRAMRISADTIKDREADSLYELMVKRYKGAGQYWSWDEKAADAHWGASGSDILDVMIEGRVRTQDIDWFRTLYVTTYDLNDEKEITLKNDSFVKIVKVEFQKDDRKAVSEPNLIVPAGHGRDESNKIEEARAQMELPFDGGKKPIHVDFIDAVEELAVKMNYTTNLEWDSVMQNALKRGVKRAQDCIESEETNKELLMQWVELNEKTIDRSLFSDRFIKDEQVPDGIIPLDFFYETDVLHQYGKDGFSDKGWALLSKQLPKVVTKVLDEGWRDEKMFDVMGKSFHKNNGLIDCWRAVILDERVEDVFATVTQKYKGVGLYWSWSEGSAQPYNGASNLSSRVDAILHAKVRPEDVDWARTVYVNVYDLREEQEVSVKGHVLLDHIELRNVKGKSSIVDLKGLVIPVGYQGHWARYK